MENNTLPQIIDALSQTMHRIVDRYGSSYETGMLVNILVQLRNLESEGTAKGGEEHNAVHIGIAEDCRLNSVTGEYEFTRASSQEAKGGEEGISDICLLIQKTIRTQCTDYDRSREYNAAIAANKVCDIVSAFFMNTKSPSQEAKGGEYKFSRDEQKKEIEKFLRASFPEDYFFVDSLDNVPLDEITEIILQYIEIHSAAASQEAKAIAEKVEKAYWQWCKETKRNGSVLVGGSIKEFFQYLSQFSSPTENEK